MHLRRALLLFAIVLGLTAIASSVAPPPRDATRNGGPPATTEAPPPLAGPVTPAQTLAFGYPPPAARPRPAAVDQEDHAVVTVRTKAAGEASIPRLGLTADAAPETPASFDVLLTDPGRYDVIFQPAGGQPSRIGTVVVRE